jgi:ureidoglycolate lyase
MSKLVKVKELSAEAFRHYGSYAQMINPDAPKLGAAPVEFFRDMVQLDLGGCTLASFSTCRVQTRPNVVDVTEYHTACGEGILPLDADVLIHVAPASADGLPPLDDIEVFRVAKGTMVTIRPGVWHHAPFAHGKDTANVLIVLPERTYANDCDVIELDETEQVQVIA